VTREEGGESDRLITLEERALNEIEGGEYMKSHKDLDVWKKSMEMVANIYRLTRQFPSDEQYGLSSQIRRSAISIPSNIAEGAARNSDKEFKQFLYISLGSAAEVETQLIIAEKLGFLDSADIFQNDISDIRKMLTGLISYVSKRNTMGKVK
jgi:four helix bundle protein